MSDHLDRLALRVLLPGFTGTHLPDDVALLLEEGLGGVCLFGSNTTAGPAAVAELVAAVHGARPDAVVAVDEEGGDVTRLHADAGSPVLGAATLGAVGDLDLTRATGALVGAELAAAGVDLCLGPVADVNSDAANPVIGTRSFGADAAAVGEHVAAWVGGLQAAGVAACVKHFPGHGDTAVDSHLALPVVDVAAEVLEARELAPFRAAVDAGARAVMTAHLVVPALDPDRPATLSPAVLGRLRALGFDGAVVTDALDMAGVSPTPEAMPAAAVAALAAGADLLCLGPATDVALVRAVRDAVVGAVGSGELDEARLAAAGDRAAALRRRPVIAPAADPTGQVPGARRALRVEGTVPDLRDAVVVRVETAPTIAVGHVPWGLPADVVVAPGDPLPPGPVVVQVRDAHRQPAVVETLRTATGPLVVVELGWPGPAVVDAPRVCGFGASRPVAAAVAERLGLS